MKKLLTVVLIATSLFSLFGCKKTQKENVNAENASNVNAVEALKSRGVFVLGLDDSFPPLGYRNDDNEIVGYDIDLAKEVTKRLGVEFKAQPIDWSAKELELETGEIDCIWNGFTITEERKEALSFTEAYLNNAQVLVVRNGSNIKSLADFAGKTLGIQSGSSAEEAIEDNPAFAESVGSIIKFKDNVTALNDLDIGGVDGVVMDSIVANNVISENNKPFYIVEEALAAEGYGIGFRKTEPELRDAVWNILKEMQADGTVEAISNKWFGTNISVIK